MYKYIVSYLYKSVTIEKKEVLKESSYFVTFVDNPTRPRAKQSNNCEIFDSFNEAQNAALKKLEDSKNAAAEKVARMEKLYQQVKEMKEEYV